MSRPPYNREFHQALYGYFRKHYIDKDLIQSDFAWDALVEPTYMSRLLNGLMINPSINVLMGIATALAIRSIDRVGEFFSRRWDIYDELRAKQHSDFEYYFPGRKIEAGGMGGKTDEHWIMNNRPKGEHIRH